MKVGILGSGAVGESLANGFLKHDHHVMRGSRFPEKMNAWVSKAGSKASIGTFEETAQFGELIVFAVKGTAAEAILSALPPGCFDGKTVIDPTNPIADAAPINGVLQYFTSPNESLMERLQKKAPLAHWVKAFNSVGHALMVHPDFHGPKPTMFICGDEANAKAQVSEILAQFGWEIQDMGKSESARAIEPLCMLWCIPGFLSNHWSHAFKLLTV